MKYLYSKPMCSACVDKKNEFKRNGLVEGVDWVERDAGRLTRPADDMDGIDRDARVQLSMQNNILPVVVER